MHIPDGFVSPKVYLPAYVLASGCWALGISRVRQRLSGEMIPTGITRHIIPHRALNINIPLDVLGSDWSQERKGEWLHDWLMERMAANAIRFYSESTFSFNE